MNAKYESSFTQRVIAEIENARLDKGISVQDLISRSGIRRSSYFRKMRGETSFTTEDVDALANALGLDPMIVFKNASEEHIAPVTVGRFLQNDAPDELPRAAFTDNGDDGADLPE
ncbi:helix-turn-helix domain-containing protein [Leucobacter soli]|uniref:HTH cro/C1-type domain-containing protein n=1 Tax=Leucobacter soli TaxID=2812850 RepID=A0A916K0W7_9MICO|nr:helix-turn-helix transcriptional regulator [Leucobacter soli]CAG7622364.1 hypothetical protein LEUCIP111803_02509 [Leucobacter soli]